MLLHGFLNEEFPEEVNNRHGCNLPMAIQPIQGKNIVCNIEQIPLLDCGKLLDNGSKS